MAETEKRSMSWGAAIVASTIVFQLLMMFFAIGPSQFITIVNKTYAAVPNSAESRFIRDAIIGGFYVIIVGWLAVGAYQIQGLAKRSWRIIGAAVLLVLPALLFCVVPAALHGIINTVVSSRPLEDQGALLYTLDQWLYTGYWAATIGLITLLTPAWAIVPKKLVERFSPEGRAARQSAFGRPVVSPT